MSTLSVLFLALVCSILPASIPADHGQILIADQIYEDTADTMHGNNYNRLVYNENTKEVTSVINRTISINNGNRTRQYIEKVRRKRETDPCDFFSFNAKTRIIGHPRMDGETTYSRNKTCITLIEANDGEVIHLTFIDVFHIEEHPKCEYDYIEIRDGQYGFAKSHGRFCGRSFPQRITSSGPYLWLKFKSDENIEYEGFKIQIEFAPGSNSHPVPKECIIPIEGVRFGELNSSDVEQCRKVSPNDIDILWNITTPEGTLIYLDFVEYVLKKPNECEFNLVQVFGAKPDCDHTLAHYCGSVANPVMTKPLKGEEGTGNIMFIRFYASKEYRKESFFVAKFVSIRTIKNDESCSIDEFNCSDGTCIDEKLKCDDHVDCRLKTDEDKDTCKKKAESQIKEPHVLAILIIFSLILSGMTFVFLFKCIRKLYQDHKIIKEHIKRSCEDRLDDLAENQLTLDAEHLERDSRRRASLERENHTNEMYKQERNKRKPSSIDSDFPQETQLDIDEEIWRREAESVPIDTDDIRIEHKGRLRRSDTSKKEESIRSRTKGEEKKEIRDASVGPPDTKESGCQTRESLFQVEAPGSDSTTSGSNSRGFSTFGYSGATIARPSPAPANTSEITIELLRQVTPQESIKSQKKTDRRPMSTETTRSAPDVIIVSKPIR